MFTQQEPLENISQAVWNKNYTKCALIGKNEILVVSDSLELCSTHDEKTRIISAVWSGPFLFFTTVNSLKCILSDGSSTFLTAISTLLHLLCVKNNTAVLIGPQNVFKYIVFDKNFLDLQLALLQNKKEKVEELIQKGTGLMGKAVIAKIRESQLSALALGFVKTTPEKFSLSLECGEINTAIELAEEINTKENWLEAARKADLLLNENAKQCYEKASAGEEGAFLAFVTGDSAYIEKETEKALSLKNNSLALILSVLSGNREQQKIVYQSMDVDSLFVENEMEKLIDQRIEQQPILFIEKNTVPVLESDPVSTTTLDQPGSEEELEEVEEVEEVEETWDVELEEADLFGNILLVLLEKDETQEEALRFLEKTISLAKRERLEEPLNQWKKEKQAEMLFKQESMFTMEKVLGTFSEATAKTTAGSFSSALSILSSLFPQLIFISTKTEQDLEQIQELIYKAAEYTKGLKMEKKRKELAKNPAAKKECLALSTYFTFCDLLEDAKELTFKAAILNALKNDCKKLANELATDFRETFHRDTSLTRKVQKETADWNEDSIEIDYSRKKRICSGTFSLISGKEKIVCCGYCHSVYKKEFEGSICHICELAYVNKDE